MITVTLSRNDIQTISNALNIAAKCGMRHSAKGRELADLLRKTPSISYDSVQCIIEKSKLAEEHSAYYIALKEGTFDKILKSTKEVENDA
jgi:hypothetical protein